MRKVFITGGAGFIGSHCAISLIENGFVPIIIDDFSNSDIDIIKKLKLITKKKIIFYKENLKNKKKLCQFLKNINVMRLFIVLVIKQLVRVSKTQFHIMKIILHPHCHYWNA
jgi:UDP-glucose 4-epimerase